MNIAFSTLFLITLFLPGYILRHVYLSSGYWALNGAADYIHHNTDSNNNPFASEVLTILFISIIIHTIAILIPCIQIYYVKALTFLTNSSPSIPNISLPKFSLYFIALCILSGILGFCCYWIVRKFKLDMRFKCLRFKFYWFYILSGECLAFPENGAQKIPDGAYIAATIEQNGKSYLYYGLLEDYVVEKSGELKTLLIKYARRRELNNDSSEKNEDEDDKRFYPIRGEWLTLKYKDIKSLNIEYFYLEPNPKQ